MKNIDTPKAILLELNYSEMQLQALEADTKILNAEKKELTVISEKLESMIVAKEEIINHIPSYNEETYKAYKELFIIENEIKANEKMLDYLKEKINSRIKEYERKKEGLENILSELRTKLLEIEK